VRWIKQSQENQGVGQALNSLSDNNVFFCFSKSISTFKIQIPLEVDFFSDIFNGNFQIINIKPMALIKTLVIQKQATQKLSSQQKAFNRNINKLQNLQREIVRFRQKLEEDITYYTKELFPLVEKKTVTEKTMLTIFYEFITRPAFLRPAEKKVLKELMEKLMNDYVRDISQEPDADVKKIFRFVFGSSYEEVKEEAFEDFKTDMKSMFDEMGLDINQLKHNMTEEEMIRHLNEVRAEMWRKEQEAGEPASKTTTKRESKQQAKQRLAEEARNKSISSIYKTLVKVLHPDLEPDENKKKEKEELMKKVTVAYHNKDLYTMLKLELEVLHSEEQHTDKLSNEKIKAYNELLRNQIEDLELELDTLYQNPRYTPLLAFVQFPHELLGLNLTHKARELRGTVASLQRSLAALQGNEREKENELRVILKEAKYAQAAARREERQMASQMSRIMGDYPF
jgi:hypothetical protein